MVNDDYMECMFAKNLILVVPENVQLMANKTRVCQDGVVSFTCSAVGNPVVHTYQLYENNMLIGSSSSGVWSRNMSSGGMFNYTCMANNTVGTANSTSSVSITVNGKRKVTRNTFITKNNIIDKYEAIQI